MGVCMSNTSGLLETKKSGPHALNPRGEHPAIARTNVGVPCVSLLTQETIHYVFNPDLVDKEQCCFGYSEVPETVRRGHCPSMFANGEEHRRKKAFLMDVLKECKNRVPSLLLKTILGHFEEWSLLKSVPDFEDRVYYIISEALTEAVFGTKLDGRLALTWLNGMIQLKTWIPMPAYKKKHNLAMEALPKLLQSIGESPKYEELTRLCRQHSLQAEDGMVTLMYAVLFNGCGAVTTAIVTSVARLQTILAFEKKDLQTTTQQVISEFGNMTEESLGEMRELESFLLEVLRMHPPVFDFWAVAKKDFTVSAGKVKEEVRQGEQLLGSCFWAQRDVSAFLNPGLFRCRRFLDDEEKKNHLVFSHGRFLEAASLDNHQCPGMGIAFILMKATLAVLLCYCSWDLQDMPVWSDMTSRLGKPDQLVCFTWFHFHSAEARRALGL
ncbi:PREDICTED: fatty acid hydroperoxide lyase, chloroplastic-like [Branchiostoma belcheri]|uniref:sterol 22-desaturase n=1 Tax=Branchiostoma belcheri TaxID=7741 RepID=A0A6P5ABW9_BRABE|nr:PREDICTED: fatty acid hydroperoxide lyase, chloroplastic-like [Branchiostoma belcheri]